MSLFDKPTMVLSVPVDTDTWIDGNTALSWWSPLSIELVFRFCKFLFWAWKMILNINEYLESLSVLYLSSPDFFL